MVGTGNGDKVKRKEQTRGGVGVTGKGEGVKTRGKGVEKEGRKS